MSREVYSIGDKLLFVLSAKREIAWSSFKSACDELALRAEPKTVYTDSTGDQTQAHRYYQALRTIDSLGHCDFSFGPHGDIVCASRPILARLPLAGLPRAVLCGARSVSTWAHLSDVANSFVSIRVEKAPTKNVSAVAPARIVVEADALVYLEQFAETLGITFCRIPPAWSLAYVCGSLEDYWDSIEWRVAPELNWPRRDFDPVQQCFGQANELKVSDKMRLSSYTDPMTWRRTHQICAGEMKGDVDRDWGRYMILADRRHDVLVYDQRRCIMCVPRRVPLPRLFSRALALCAGMQPNVIRAEAIISDSANSDFFYAYRAVPRQIAQLVSEKLKQRIKAGEVHNLSEGEV